MEEKPLDLNELEGWCALCTLVKKCIMSKVVGDHEIYTTMHILNISHLLVYVLKSSYIYVAHSVT